MHEAILHCLYKFFVDDTDLFRHCFVGDLCDEIAKVNDDIEKLIAWAKRLGISVNANKTKAMICGSAHNLKLLETMSYPPIIVNGLAIPFSNVASNLGVLITSDLTWNEHVSSIITKVNGSLSSLYRNAFTFPLRIKISLIHHLIFPLFDYVSLVYDSATKYLEYKLLKLQNRCVRFVFNIRKYEHITPYRRKLLWLTPGSRRKYLLGIQTFKVLAHKRPIYLFDELAKWFSMHMRELRKSSTFTFDIPLVTCKTYSESYCISAMTFWNSLPNDITEVDSLNIFKSKLFKYLYNFDL